MLSMDIPSSNDDRVDEEIASASIIILLPSLMGVGGVTSTGTFLLFIDPLGDRILSNERSRLVDFIDPNCKSFAGSFFATVRSSRLFLLERRGLLLLLALVGGRGEVGRLATEVEETEEEVSTGSSS